MLMLVLMLEKRSQIWASLSVDCHQWYPFS